VIHATQQQDWRGYPRRRRVGSKWGVTGNSLVQGALPKHLRYAKVKKTLVKGLSERVRGDIKGVPVPSLPSLRRQAGLSQRALAERAGLGRNTISRLEQGANARYETITLLAQALQVPPTRLIKGPRLRRPKPLSEGTKHS
jgi:DNA-binding XRE family transcriptional regulator